MSDRKMSTLPVLTTITGDEKVWATVNGADYQVSLETIAEGMDQSVVTPEDLALKANLTVVQALQAQVNEIVVPDVSGLVTVEQLNTGLGTKATTSSVQQLTQQVAAIVVPDVSGLATSLSVSQGLALKADQTALQTLSNTVDAITVPDVSGLATAQSVTDGLALKADQTALQVVSDAVDAIVVPDVSGFATTAAVEAAIADIVIPDVSGLATTQALTDGLALKSSQADLDALAVVVGQIQAGEEVDLSGYTTVAVTNTLAGRVTTLEGIPPVDISGLATTQSVTDGLALKADVTALAALEDVVSNISAPDLSALATKTEVTDGLALKADLTVVETLQQQVDDIVVPDVSGLATTQSVTDGLALKADQTALQTLSNAVDAIVVPDVSGLALKTEVADGLLLKVNQVDFEPVLTGLTGKAEQSTVVALQQAVANIVVPDVSGLATTQSVTDGLALKADQSALVALQEEVDAIAAPDLSGLATTQALTDGLALKADQTALQSVIDDVAAISAPDLSALATKTEVTDGLALKADVTTVQALQEQVDGISAPDLSGLATKTEVTDGLALKADQSALTALSEEVAGIVIPDVSGFVTAQSLADGLAGKADTTALNQKADSADLDALAQTVGQITIPDVSGLATTQSVTDGLALKADQTALAALEDTVANLPPNPDLTAYLALAEAAAAGDQVVYEEGVWKTRDAKVGRILWVGASPGALVTTGSEMNPFVNIQDAIDVIPNNSPGYIIMVASRNGGGNHAGFTIPDNKINIFIQGWGCIDAHPVRIDGQVLITGANNTRHKLKDMAIWSTTTTQVPLVFDGSQGRHYLDNVTVERFSGSTADAVSIQGTSRNWIDCHNCNFNGNVRLGGTPAANTALFMRGTGSAGSDFIMEQANYTLMITDTINIKHIQHDAGNLALNNVSNFGGNSGVAIDSTAATGLFSIRNSDMQTPAGVFKKINKTGAAPYVFHNVNRDTANDVITGTRITMSGTTMDLRADHAATNYTGAVDGSVYDHLVGIDAEFGTLGEALALKADTTTVQALQDQVDNLPAPSVILPTFEGNAIGGETAITATLSVLKGNGYDVLNLDLNAEYRLAGTTDEWTSGTVFALDRGNRGPYPVNFTGVAAGDYEVQGHIVDTMDPSVSITVALGTVTVTPTP